MVVSQGACLRVSNDPHVDDADYKTGLTAYSINLYTETSPSITHRTPSAPTLHYIVRMIAPAGGGETASM
jgi:hypothetical protein